MPSDANGNYSLPDGYLAVTGATVLASQHNPPLEDLAESMSQRVMASGAKPMTGALKAFDGTVAAPGITMASATSSGWYKTADGWGFSIGGTMVAEITSGGIRTGARYVGEVFDWTGSSAPSLCVLPYGQTLSRALYPRLWAFAQIEIAAGNTLYNNGNGSTTFGVPDMRGRLRVTKDNMGGSAASRVTSTYFGTSAEALGAVGGAENHTLTAGQIPSITSANASQAISVSSGGVILIFTTSGSLIDQAIIGGSGTRVGNTTSQASTNVVSTGTNSISVTSNNTGGNPHNNTPAAIITNCALFAGD